MTPDILTISRTYGAVPGAPVYRSGDCQEVLTPGGDVAYRDANGLLWIRDPEHVPTSDPNDLGMLLDITDAGTGGVLATAWAEAGGSVWIGPKSDGWCARPPGASILDEPTGRGATLAEAVARAAVARGRAG